MKHLNLELARLERRIAPGLTIGGINIAGGQGDCISENGSGSHGRSNDGTSPSGSRSSKSKSSHSNQGSNSHSS